MLSASASSLNAYGKIDEAEQTRLDARRQTRKRITIIAVSSVFLVAIVVAAVLGVTQTSENSHDGQAHQHQPMSTTATSLKAVCDTTLYNQTCWNSLSPLVNSSSDNLQPEEIFKLAIQVALEEIQKVSPQIFGDFGSINDTMSKVALKDCDYVFGLAIDHLNFSLSSLTSSGIGSNSLLEALDDLVTWLSSAGTYLETCLDSLEDANNQKLKTEIQNILKNSTEMTSNSLAIVSWIQNVADSLHLHGRRLLTSSSSSQEKPEWLSSNARRLLFNSTTNNNATQTSANIVVAKDGSGHYTTIGAALQAVPQQSNNLTVIYVKKGVYYENVIVQKTMWNVMMYGDGMDATIVSGGLNVVDGTPTFSSATFAVFGKGFMARDMGFYNTAGAIKQQAVALLSDSDMSVFYRCRMDAFQDTLYVHSNRQFYSQCNIYGTVDFIFGNAAVVFQNCNILPKKPLLGQQDTITAQGRFDPHQNTGISIQNCTIWPSGDLSSVQTYLGRPWKNYSTTVFINSYMSSIISPQGWLPWIGTTAPNTIFYAEYANYGPGSVKTYRVKWRGLKNITRSIASKFTVKTFIQGNKWIPRTLNYKLGL